MVLVRNGGDFYVSEEHTTAGHFLGGGFFWEGNFLKWDRCVTREIRRAVGSFGGL